MRWWLVALIVVGLALAGCSAPSATQAPHLSSLPGGEGSRGIVATATRPAPHLSLTPDSGEGIAPASHEPAPVMVLRCPTPQPTHRPRVRPTQPPETTLEAAARERTDNGLSRQPTPIDCTK